MPLASVIVPVYNGAQTIHATLESVFQQTAQDFELIVIDDGSTDSTLEVVSKFDDPRLRVFSYCNAGVATSRNRGVDHASGKYISFIDADDLWTPKKLALQLEALESTPEAAVAYSWTNYIDQEGRFIDKAQRVDFSGDVYAELLLRDFLESASNVTIRHQVFLEFGGFDLSLTGAADWDFFLRLAKHYSFVAVPHLGVLYRLLSSSMSANLAIQEKECLTVLDRAYEQAPPALQPLKQRSLGQLYQYLSFKAMHGSLHRPKGASALHYLWQSLAHSPQIAIQQPRLTSVLFLKILAALLLPRQSQQLIDQLRG
ncbi:glycosyl transferase, group 2 family protein [Synechococcus sp. PCC 7335]|uniref:glycosyltransferase n=1 Tax=Synechococcus sp. (strain ATCC 29403 / PCC 7335) TaxID=91464 RepID=UPI00017EC3D8|nr:glycosyltransferase [Synechococcus sp. PCC 7335]EDX84168.1 glycosyl transferase, group 2 family protein [Synechococcus sp. PCC 7335]